MVNWMEVVVSPTTRLAEAIAKIDSSGLQVAIVLDEHQHVRGVVTDGNIRRAILAGKSLDTPVGEIMTTEPTVATESTPREELLAVMRSKVIHHLPIVDHSGRAIGLVTLDELVGVADRSNWVVLMAGGLGTRLQPLTEHVPKPLLKVGGKPILESILEGFVEQGFKKVFLSVNYKADMIRDHFGDGQRWGVDISYLQEETRLGTAGALSLLPERPSTPIVVMNGDVLTRANFGQLLSFHQAHGSAATMAVREYDFQVPYGVVRVDGTQIRSIEEKPVHHFYVNAGIYVLSPDALDHLPISSLCDMPRLFGDIIASGKSVVAYPLREFWLDVGRVEELDRAQREWVGAAK